MKDKFKKRQTTVAKKMKSRGDTFQVCEIAGKGNTRKRFHGTKRKCLVGEESLVPCTDSQCAVCNIIRRGFQTGQREDLRFGKGIYCTSTSSKASDYAMCVEHKSIGQCDGLQCAGRRAMFVVKVVAGTVSKRFDSWTEKDQKMTQPPPGCDSVVGDVEANAEGNFTAPLVNTMNYDELVVYCGSSILPAFLIIYSY